MNISKRVRKLDASNNLCYSFEIPQGDQLVPNLFFVFFSTFTSQNFHFWNWDKLLVLQNHFFLEQNSSNNPAMMGGHPHTHHPLPNGSNTLPGPGGGGTSGSGTSMHGASTCNGDEEDFSVDAQSNNFLDPSFQCIRFQPFQQQSWSIICDSSLKEL